MIILLNKEGWITNKSLLVTFIYTFLLLARLTYKANYWDEFQNQIIYSSIYLSNDIQTYIKNTDSELNFNTNRFSHSKTAPTKDI
jgi:predicted secreted acid phosphatase